MALTRTCITDVVIVEPVAFEDERGWFMESFNERRFHAELAGLGLPVPRPFVQDNHSCSMRGVLRGLHFQTAPHAQGKLVRVVRGAAFDVAVDIRPDSPTFRQWVGVELTAANRRQLWVPEGLAHGFLSLEDDTHFLYKTTDYYAKDCEHSIIWNDPSLAVAWPLASIGEPSLAPKDACARASDDVIRMSIGPGAPKTLKQHQPAERAHRLADTPVSAVGHGSQANQVRLAK